VIKPYKATAL